MKTTTSMSDKRIEKIRLINWQGFVNETIDTGEKSLLLTGGSGSGKSTAIDAIMLVMTGNDNLKFNCAADTKNRKRSIKSYIHGAQNDETQNYLRKGPVSSYVAIQFSEYPIIAEKRNFVLGVNIESSGPLSESLNKMWFRYEGTLDEIPFIENNKPKTSSEFKDWLDDNSEKGKTDYSQRDKEAREDILFRRLGFNEKGKKYVENLKKFVAFSPMSDIDRFMKENILPKERVDIDGLIEYHNGLRESEEKLKKFEEEICELEEILGKADEVSKLTSRLEEIELMIKISKYEAQNQTAQKRKNVINSLEKSIRSLEEKIEEIRGEKTQLKEKKELIEEQLKSQDDGEAYKIKLKDEIENSGEAIKTKSYQIETVRCTVNSIIAFERKNNVSIGTNVNDLLSSELDIAEKESTLGDIRDRISEERAAVDSQYNEKEKKLAEISDRLVESTRKVSDIEKGMLPIDERVNRLKQAIEDEFASLNIKNSPVLVVCKCLELVSEEWRAAIESYLGSQRFYLIVEPQYYDIAARVYDKRKDKIQGVGVVNMSKIMSKIDVQENSLARLVTSDYPYVKGYADFLLGRVIICQNVDELKSYDVAITKECMLYKGHVLRNIKRTGEGYFLGEKARQSQLKQAKEEKDRILLEKNLVLGEKSEIESKLIAIKSLQREIDSIGKYLNAPKEKAQFEQRLQRARKELEEFKAKERNVFEWIEKLQSDKAETERLIKEKENEETKVRDTLSEAKSNLNVAKTAYEEDMAKAEVIGAEIEEIRSVDEARYIEAKKSLQKGIEGGRDYEYYAEQYEPIRKRTETDRNNAGVSLQILQSKYYKGKEYGIGIEFIGYYKQQRENLIGKEIVKLKNSIERMREDARINFREKYITKMREQIENARKEISRLNRDLREIDYGKDHYEFYVGPSDDTLKKEIYEMLMDPAFLENDPQTTIFDDVSKDHEETIKNLFERMFDPKLSEVERSEMTDYTQLLKCDIKITNSAGKSQMFSKTVGYASGGEAETPYYVSVVASFKSIFGHGGCAKLVIFDEAFARMDDRRIESMLKFLKELDYQVIVAMPPNRATVARNYIDTWLTVKNYIDRKIMKVHPCEKPREQDTESLN